MRSGRDRKNLGVTVHRRDFSRWGKLSACDPSERIQVVSAATSASFSSARVSDSVCQCSGLIGEPDIVRLTGRRHSHDGNGEDRWDFSAPVTVDEQIARIIEQAQAQEQGLQLTGEGGLLHDMIRQAVEAALHAAR